MNIARNFYPKLRQNGSKCFYKNFRILSAKYESTQATQPQIKEEKFGFEDIKVLERTDRRKPPIEPFMKNVFISNFNTNILTYPEILSKDERYELDQRVEKLEKVFKDTSKSSEEKRNTLKQFRMYAAPAKLTNNGLAMNVTERLRYLETIATDLNLAKEISEHWVALEILQKGLTPEDYNKLLPEILDGDQTISLYLREPVATRITEADFKTGAQIDKNGIWRINGHKEYKKHNGFILVLAMMEGSRVGLFLVHPETSGIAHNENLVTFRDVPGTPIDQISEDEMASLLSLTRLDTSVLLNSILKNTVHDCVEACRAMHFNGKPVADLPSIRCRIGDALLTMYAADSAAYLAAGLLDGYHTPDVQIEVAMCKAYITKYGLDTLLSLLTINGIQLSEKFTQRIDEFRRIAYSDEVDDQVNTYIAMNGIHHASRSMADEVKMIRNPLLNPTFFLKKVFTNRRQESDDPVLDLHLSEYLHPSLKPASELLEYCVIRMKYATECLMSRHGLDIGQALLDLSRLSQAATEIYVLTAALGRASRSYCIGLRNSEVDMKLAASIAEKSKPFVKQLIADIDNGEFLNLDLVKTQLGQKVLDTNTILVEKPIERVFW